MSKNSSTQFPSPPELQPIPSTRAKLWCGASLFLVIGGLVLICAGCWIFTQQQIEASKPAPRLLEVSVADIEPTPSPTLDSNPVPISQTVVPMVTTATQANSTAVPDTAAAIIVPMVTPEASKSSNNVLSVSARESKFVEEITLSLADNPLLVIEGEETPVAAGMPLVDRRTEEALDTAAGLPLKRVVAESIGLDANVIAVGWQWVVQDGIAANVWAVADYAAGWHSNSKLPGQNGNIVLSAHHNIKGEVFRYTVDFEPGDVITLFDDVQSYDYVVEDKFIVKDKGEPEAVRRENAKWIGPFDEERLTLVTCWPYNNNTHRLIVIAKPVEKS